MIATLFRVGGWAVREHWPAALVLGLAAVLGLAPFATAGELALVAFAAAAGAIAGTSLAVTRLRGVAVIAGLAVLGGAGWLASTLVLRSRIPAALLGPERAAWAADAFALVALTGLAALALAFVSSRIPAGRVAMSAILVAAVVLLLLAHRGGSINRPLIVGDLAWLRGYHPAFLLGLAGAAAALAGTLALYRPTGRHRVGRHLLAALLASVALLLVFPALGVFSFSDRDPLALAGPPGHERGFFPGRGGARPAEGGGGGRGLGLLREGGQDGTAPEVAPFLDDYSSDGAQAPVAVVVLHDDVSPASGALYFRQVAFSRFNGRRLVRAFAPGVDDDLFPRFPGAVPMRRPLPPGQVLRRRVPATVSLLRDHFQPLVLADGVELASAPNADPSLFRRTYRSVSWVLEADFDALFGHAAGDPAWPPAVRRAYLELPDDPRYRDLAARILELVRPEYRDDPWARSLAVAVWLERNTRYSLHSRHASADDPTASFLFGDRIGYCVHLAHAAAYLARALGVPARVAAGYAYAEENRGNGSALLLRAGDAHAWAEVRLDGVGWGPLDPGPPSIDPPMPAPDMDLQSLLGEMARGEDNPLARELPRAWTLPTARQLLAALAVLALLWLLSGHAVKAWRRIAPRCVPRDRRARLAYRAALDRLAEVGLARSHGESRERFARRAARVSPTFETLTEIHLASTWTGRPAPPARARTLARRVAREVRRARGLRAALGTLAPWNWTRSR
ncbi:MAG: hypothetical protein Kow0062_20150 [Acidobacteriota bacterium]